MVYVIVDFFENLADLFFIDLFSLFLSLLRISQRLRVLGSLTIIILVFIITAVIVKVPLEPLPFFCITMVKIVIINCEFSQFV